ncbi:MAG: hypothetical protein AAGA53_02100 [Pseudomonadota bacterium]
MSDNAPNPEDSFDPFEEEEGQEEEEEQQRNQQGLESGGQSDSFWGTIGGLINRFQQWRHSGGRDDEDEQSGRFGGSRGPNSEPDEPPDDERPHWGWNSPGRSGADREGGDTHEAGGGARGEGGDTRDAGGGARDEGGDSATNQSNNEPEEAWTWHRFATRRPLTAREEKNIHDSSMESYRDRHPRDDRPEDLENKENYGAPADGPYGGRKTLDQQDPDVQDKVQAYSDENVVFWHAENRGKMDENGHYNPKDFDADKDRHYAEYANDLRDNRPEDHDRLDRAATDDLRKEAMGNETNYVDLDDDGIIKTDRTPFRENSDLKKEAERSFQPQTGKKLDDLQEQLETLRNELAAQRGDRGDQNDHSPDANDRGDQNDRSPDATDRSSESSNAGDGNSNGGMDQASPPSHRDGFQGDNVISLQERMAERDRQGQPTQDRDVTADAATGTDNARGSNGMDIDAMLEQQRNGSNTDRGSNTERGSSSGRETAEVSDSADGLLNSRGLEARSRGGDGGWGRD